MKKIHKYPLKYVTSQEIPLPKGSTILSCQLQNNDITLWAEIHADESVYENRRFFIVGTGQTIPDVRVNYIATVQQGPMVWHVYESGARV